MWCKELAESNSSFEKLNFNRQIHQSCKLDHYESDKKPRHFQMSNEQMKYLELKKEE